MKTPSFIAKTLVLLLLITGVLTIIKTVRVQAAVGLPFYSSQAYAEAYASKKILVYKNANLTVRGTISPAKAYNSYIDPGDSIRIEAVYSSYIIAKFPTPSGWKKGYIRTSDVLLRNQPIEGGHCHAKVTVFATEYSTSKYGTMFKDDISYSFGNAKNNRIQIMYSAPNGSRAFKIGYINKTDLDKVKGQNNNTPSSNNTYTFVSQKEITNAASKYGISTSSNAYKALLSINSKYQSRLNNNKNGTNIFLFEGVGNNLSSGTRFGAMCVVVKNRKIVYINRNSSTIPDYPFKPSKNGGTAMPTIRDGIYNFSTVNHKGSYAALSVNNASVVRFSSKNSFYNSTSSAINVHRRSTDYIAPSGKSWVNSAGCQLIGRNSEYLSFIKAVGIVNGSCVTKYKNSVTGKIILDRTYAYSYLINVGYSSSAINRIRG